MSSAVAIYGAGGFAREVAPLARTVNPADGATSSREAPVFVSDVASQHGTVINGLRVISFDELCTPEHRDRAVVIAIADQKARRAIAATCENAGLRFGDIRAATHRAYDDVRIEEGSILCEYTIITSNARIGRHFHCNLFSYVAHDCVIGDFVTFAPHVNCNGNVTIEDDVYVGTGAFLRQGSPGRPLRIGRGAVIGMGAVVTKDVPAGAVMVGNPAHQLEKTSSNE